MDPRQSPPSKSPGKKGPSVFRMASENADLRALEAINNFMSDSFTKQPPELTDVVHEYPHLTKLADHIHNLMATASEKPLSMECARAAELGMRYLLNEYYQMKETSQQADASLGNAKKLVDYAALLAQNPTDITLAKLQIVELQRENADLKKSLVDCRNENLSMQDDVEKAYAQKLKLVSDLARQASQHKDEISQQKQEYNRLEDNRQSVVDELKAREEDINRLKRQLADSLEETGRANRAYAAMKDRLQKKNEMISKLRTEVRQKEIELQEAKIQHEQAELSMSTEFMSQSKLADDKSNAAFKKLLRFTQQQSKQIDKLTEANAHAADVIERQNQLFDTYEDQMAGLTNSHSDITSENAALRERTQTLEEQLAEYQQKYGSSSSELEHLRDIVSECISAVAPQYIISEDQLPEVVKQLAGTRIDPETAKILRRLNATADALAKFIVKLVKNGTVDIECLRNNGPLVRDYTQRADILAAVEETRIFLDEVCYALADEDPAAKYVSNLGEHFEMVDTDETALASVLAALLQRQRDYNRHLTDELAVVRDVLPAFDCNDFELPSAVAEYILQLQPVFTQLLQVIGRTLKYHGDITDIFRCLATYVEESSAVLGELDTDVRPLINFTGKITAMPNHIVEVLTELKGIVEGGTQVQLRELQEALIENDKMRVNYERQLDEAADRDHKKEKVIQKLQSQLEKMSAEKTELENQIEDLNTEHEESAKTTEQIKIEKQIAEEEKITLQNERDRLETTLKERQQLYEKRLKNAVEKERSVAEDELARERRKHEEQKEALEKQLTALNKKYNKEKASLTKTINLYNAQKEEHQKLVQQMNQEKLDLSATIDQIRDNPEHLKEIDALHQKLAEARLKNRELVAELSRTQSQLPQKSFASTISKSPSHIRAESRQEEALIETVGKELESFVGKETNWNRSRVIQAVKAAMQRIDQLEKAATRTPRKARKDEWTSWADSLLSETQRGYDPKTPEPVMRATIEEIVRSVRAPSKLVILLQRLRDEKALLMRCAQPPMVSGNGNKGKDGGADDASKKSATMKNIINIVCFIAFARSKKQQTTTQIIETPASPVASRSMTSMLC